MEQKTLNHYFLAIRNRLQLIILFTVIFAILGGVVGKYEETKKAPDYVASAIILAGGPKAYITEHEIDYDKYEKISGNAVKFFYSIVESETTIGEAINKLQLHISYEEFEKKIKVDTIKNTDMLKIRIKDKNPELARNILDEIITISLERSKETDYMNNLKILGEIRVEEMPVKLGLAFSAKFFGVMGLLISVFLVLLFEYLDDTMKFPEDVEVNLGLPLLCVITDTTEQALEGYRVLRTNIHNFNTQRKLQTILVTSSDRNQNKSKAAVNLAITMSQIQQKVLIIDGNIRAPELHTFFKINNQIGLSNILRENIDYMEAIQTTQYENLDVLTSGSGFSNFVELLLSDKLEILLESLRKDYDFIIINSYCLGQASDAMAFSTVTDGVILVCTANKSNINDINILTKRLENLNVNILGVIFNQM